MAGVAGRSGRNPKPGEVYRFEFYYRFIPGEDPPELKALLDSIIAARGRKRRDILRAALLGGSDQAHKTAAQVEDSDIADLFEDMFADF
jgi:hypothetical protein